MVEAPRYIVERGAIRRELAFNGRIAPVVQEPLFFGTAGTVTDVLAAEGERVAESDVIAELAVADLEGRLAEAELALQAAELQLAEAQQEVADQLTDAQAALADARLRLQQTELATDSASLVAAEIALANAFGEDARRLAEARLADAENAAAARELAMQRLQAEIVRIETQIERLNRGPASQPQLALQQAQLDVQQLQRQIAERQLTAPFAGMLLLLSVRPGDAVAAFDEVGTVADMRALEIAADLSIDDITVLSVGQEALITFAGRDGLYRGEIRQLPALGSAGSRVHVAIEDPPPDLGQGELATVVVLLEEKEDALLLPLAAVRDFQGRTFVVVEAADGTPRRQDVRLGIEDGERVEIVAGVEEGQTVVGE
ncbi:MAG: HlyD family efflux transporter periplasmic adaptor subunit [Pirellulales bacterium]|nr:HlyD family efflux transporter periplasmic adaptor subunit [Pirellulales bacterium]